MAEIVKKLLLVGFFQNAWPGSTTQLVIAFIWCLCYMLFTSMFSPYIAPFGR